MKEMVDYVLKSLKRRRVRILIVVMASALVCSLLFLMPGGAAESSVLKAAESSVLNSANNAVLNAAQSIAVNPAQPEGSVNNRAQEFGLILKAKGSAESIPAPVLETNVEISVTGIILRGKVNQKFYNSSDRWVEGVYVFPLPENAAVDYMKMIIGRRIIEGQIKERGEAKRTYEAAKQEGKRASLVEQERQNIFTVSAANIVPFEEISISIEYQQEIRYADGKFGFRIKKLSFRGLFRRDSLEALFYYEVLLRERVSRRAPAPRTPKNIQALICSIINQLRLPSAGSSRTGCVIIHHCRCLIFSQMYNLLILK